MDDEKIMDDEKNMDDEKIIFEAVIAGKQMPLRIEKEKEMIHRQANELLNQRYAMYEELNKAKVPREDILAMTAYSLAVQVTDLKNLLELITNNQN